MLALLLPSPDPCISQVQFGLGSSAVTCDSELRGQAHMNRPPPVEVSVLPPDFAYSVRIAMTQSETWSLPDDLGYRTVGRLRTRGEHEQLGDVELVVVYLGDMQGKTDTPEIYL